MRRSLFHLALLAVALTLGCAPEDIVSAHPTPTIPLPNNTGYHAFGDSITYGYALPNPSTQNYTALLASATGLPHNDFGVPADEGCDVPVRIFAAADSPTLKSQTLYTLLISTNDADLKGAGPYEAVFNLCQQAAIAWIALPSEYKTLASSALVTTSGPNHFDATTPFADLLTDAQNATIQFSLRLASEGPVYVWYRIADGANGDFSVSLDGSAVAYASSATVPTISTYNGNTWSLALLRLPAIPAGGHTLLFTQTTAGVSGMGIVAIGIPPTQPPSAMPTVLVGTTPRQLIGSGYGCDIDPQNCAAYTADVTANVALLHGDGLNVTLFLSGKYMTGTLADMADALHPNPLGQQEIFRAIADVLD